MSCWWRLYYWTGERRRPTMTRQNIHSDLTTQKGQAFKHECKNRKYLFIYIYIYIYNFIFSSILWCRKLFVFQHHKRQNQMLRESSSFWKPETRQSTTTKLCKNHSCPVFRLLPWVPAVWHFNQRLCVSPRSSGRLRRSGSTPGGGRSSTCRGPAETAPLAPSSVGRSAHRRCHRSTGQNSPPLGPTCSDTAGCPRTTWSWPAVCTSEWGRGLPGNGPAYCHRGWTCPDSKRSVNARHPPFAACLWAAEPSAALSPPPCSPHPAPRSRASRRSSAGMGRCSHVWVARSWRSVCRHRDCQAG